MPQFKSCLVSLLSCVNFAQILNFSELWVFQQGVNNLTLESCYENYKVFILCLANYSCSISANSLLPLVRKDLLLHTFISCVATFNTAKTVCKIKSGQLFCFCLLNTHIYFHNISQKTPNELFGQPITWRWNTRAGQRTLYALDGFVYYYFMYLTKESPARQETWFQFLGWEDALEKEKDTHSSILAWRSPRSV